MYVDAKSIKRNKQIAFFAAPIRRLSAGFKTNVFCST